MTQNEAPQKQISMNPQPQELKESFCNMTGSISESLAESNNLAQMLPNTKDVYASKIPISDGFHSKMAFKIVNKDTG